HFAKLDEAGKLGASFDAPKGLTEDALLSAQTEEGWILGA
ncbi:MAG: cobalamin biosynthesis protein CbiG, partial [Caulobacter sp.]